MPRNLSLKHRRPASRTTKKHTNPSQRVSGIKLFVVTFLSVAGVIAHVALPARAKTSLHIAPAQSISSASLLATAPTISPPTTAAEFPLGNWQTATPQEVGMDPALFAAAMDRLPSPSVVIRSGRMVGQKGDITRSGFTWSASKSLMALIFARLLQEGQIAN